MRTLLVGIAIAFVTHPAVSQLPAPEPAASSESAPTARSIFWDDYRRGWHFYEDPEPGVAPPQTQPPKIG